MQAYDAFNRRDIDAVLALMSAAVNWPNAAEGTRVLGKEEVRSYWTRQWKMVDPRVKPVRMEDDGTGRTVVDVHQVVRDPAGGVLVDEMVQHVYAIEDGLIVRMDIRSGASSEQG